MHGNLLSVVSDKQYFKNLEKETDKELQKDSKLGEDVLISIY